MSRRFLILVVVAMVAAACGDSGGGDLAAPDCAPGQLDGDLDLHNWTDYIDPELVTAFEAEYGVSVNETFYDSNEAMLPQVEAGGNDYDLIVPSDYMVTIMAEEGLLIPLQQSALTNSGNIDPLFRGAPYDPDDEFSVPYQWGTTGIGYAYAAVPDDWEPSWDVFFDPSVAPEATGAMSFLNDPRETMAAALKYLGYSVNSTSQAELDEAVELLRSVKSRVVSFVTDGTEDLLVEGETVAAHGYSGDFFLAFDEASTDDYDAYEDFGYGIPKEGGVAWVDTLAVPRTANAPCTAHTFINFLLDAENGAALSNYNFYASPNAAATPFVDPEILEDETIYPPDEVLDRLEFIEDTGDFETNYTDAFSAVKN